jgi:hypothetical protein
MSEHNKMSHDSPVYGSMVDLVKQFGIKYRHVCENIACGQQTPEEVVNSWMQSPGHRKNILTPTITHIGVGFELRGYCWHRSLFKSKHYRRIFCLQWSLHWNNIVAWLYTFYVLNHEPGPVVGQKVAGSGNSQTLGVCPVRQISLVASLQYMADHQLSLIRSSILHILSLPRHFVSQQFSLEELGPVSDGLCEIAEALRLRQIPTSSPIKTSSIPQSNQRTRVQACLSSLRRFTTMVSCESHHEADGGMEASLEAQFKLINQHPQAGSQFHGHSTLSLSIEDCYLDSNARRTLHMKIFNNELWISIWSLSLTLIPSQDPSVYPQWENSGINLQAVGELHAQASPDERHPRLFIVALTSLFVSLVEKSQGIEICSVPVEHLVAALYDLQEPDTVLDFDLPLPASNRKRAGQSMDTDSNEVLELLTPQKKAMT